MKFVDKDLLSVQEARILMEHAGEARKALALFDQEKLDFGVTAILDGIKGCLNELALKSAEETGYGNQRDKYRKNRLILSRIQEKLAGMRCVGLLEEDPDRKTAKIGVPIGVVAALVPATSPVSTTLFLAAIAVKSGNAVVFAPHPRAEKTVQKTVEILAEAAKEAGLPEGTISCLNTVTKEGTAQLLCHPFTSLVINTGIPGLLNASRESKKPFICGGIGPSPVFIERTADVRQAVKDIIESRSFDCGTSAAAEQYVVADHQIAEDARREMLTLGAYFMNRTEEEQLMGLLCRENGGRDPEYMGKPALWMAEKAGFTVPEGTRVLVSQQKYITEFNPYARALLCPVLVFYIENDWMHACEKCMELLVNESSGHTLVIHSRDEDVIRQFMLKKPVGRVLINTPASFGAMGATTNLFPSMTLGGLTAGLGITSDNVSPMNLVYIRSAAWGVRGIRDLDPLDQWEGMEREKIEEPEKDSKEAGKDNKEAVDVAGLLKTILEQLEYK